MPTAHSELDPVEARNRLEQAAVEAKRLEVDGSGHAAQAAWERYQLIADAIAAHERRAKIAGSEPSG